MKKTFPLLYNLKTELGNYSAEEAVAQGMGAADALVFLACLEMNDGRLRPTLFSKCGRSGKEFSGLQWSGLWVTMTTRFADKAIDEGVDFGNYSLRALRNLLNLFSAAFTIDPLNKKYQEQIIRIRDYILQEEVPCPVVKQPKHSEKPLETDSQE